MNRKIRGLLAILGIGSSIAIINHFITIRHFVYDEFGSNIVIIIPLS